MPDRDLLRGAWLALLLLGLGLVPLRASADSAVYGGGPLYSGGQTVMDDLRASGFTTVILFAVHPHANGDLHFNDKPIIVNGRYVGDPDWPARLATLKQAPTSIKRIEVSIGGWGVGDFDNIRTLIAIQGTGPDSVLYRNFRLLKELTGADAIDFDDETVYDLGSSIEFGEMLWDLGYSITLAPYTNMGYWQNLKNALGDKVDGIHLQVYAGGMLNDPASWSRSMGMAVDPGLWSLHGLGCLEGDTPAAVLARMAEWKVQVGIVGGFMWLYDDMLACWQTGTSAEYAAAINTGVNGGNAPPVADFDYSVSGLAVYFVERSRDDDGRVVSYSWDFGDGNTSTEANPTHVYDNPGSYTVMLTVTDDLGAQGSRSDPVSVGGANLAMNRSATGSAACSTSEGPEKAVNGSFSGGNADKFCTRAADKWLQVDLGGMRTVRNFIIRHAGAGGESTAWNTRAYTIQTSSNGSKWNTVVDVRNNSASTSSHDVPRHKARHVRLNITRPAQDLEPAARIYEFEVR